MAETLVKRGGYIDGHYVDLETLQADLSFLQQMGSKAVILALSGWCNIEGEIRFGSTMRGEGQYDYTFVQLHDWYGSPPIQHYDDRERYISGCDELSASGVSSCGPICEEYLAKGGIVRIVTDPAEIEGIDFSYEGSRLKGRAIASMPIAEDFVTIR
jgi:hypothetical protein